MATSKYRGNDIEYKNGEWFFSGTELKVEQCHDTKPCGHCGKLFTNEGHDACLGELPGLMNACCGHGIESEAYVQFLDGSCIRGKDAVEIQRILKNVANK